MYIGTHVADHTRSPYSVCQTNVVLTMVTKMHGTPRTFTNAMANGHFHVSPGKLPWKNVIPCVMAMWTCCRQSYFFELCDECTQGGVLYIRHDFLQCIQRIYCITSFVWAHNVWASETTWVVVVIEDIPFYTYIAHTMRRKGTRKWYREGGAIDFSITA